MVGTVCGSGSDGSLDRPVRQHGHLILWLFTLTRRSAAMVVVFVDGGGERFVDQEVMVSFINPFGSMVLALFEMQEILYRSAVAS